LDRRRRPITTLELTCPEHPLEAPEFPAVLLATTALGVGKGSAIFQVAREQMGLSYRQDAFLWPSSKGLQTRLIVTLIPRNDESSLPQKLRDGLLKQIDGWSEQDLARAKSMYTAAMVDGLAGGPIWLRAEAPIGPSVYDRTLLAGYWTMKSGASFDGDKLSQSLGAVGLDVLKATAKALLTGATVHVVSGS
jgi:hypothetical protein